MINQYRRMGIETAPEFYMRFALWAEKNHLSLTPEKICNQFDVSRATSFRWIRAWRNAQRAQLVGDL